MISLSRNQKIAFYAGIATGTYIMYDKLNIFDINSKFQGDIDIINDKYFKVFPALPQIYKSIENGRNDWKSDNFFLGRKRSFNSGDRDEFDKLDYFHIRGGGATYEIDPKTGIFTMTGRSPRLYINSNRINSNVKEPIMAYNYTNTEITGYFKKYDTGKKYAGYVVGCRSFASGHSYKSDNEDTEDFTFQETLDNFRRSNTYYAKIRYDGKISFAKEITHYQGGETGQPAHSDRPSMRSTEVQKGFYEMPTNKFIGVKFMCYNIPLLSTEEEKDQRVKLELWVEDLTGGTQHFISGKNDKWRKIAEHIDGYGFWTAHINPDLLSEDEYENYVNNVGTPADPLLDRNRALTESFGTVFWRNSGAKMEYKYLEVREIDPKLIKQKVRKVPSAPRNIRYTELTDTRIMLNWDAPEFVDITNPDSDIEIRDYLIESGIDRIEVGLNREIPGLRVGQDYIFRITARNTTSEEYGNPINLVFTKKTPTIAVSAPTKVQNLKVIIRSPGRITLSWDRPQYSNREEQITDGLIQYFIESGASRNTFETEIKIAGLNTVDREYFFEVRARNEDTNALSAINRITVVATKSPEAQAEADSQGTDIQFFTEEQAEQELRETAEALAFTDDIIQQDIIVSIDDFI